MTFLQRLLVTSAIFASSTAANATTLLLEKGLNTTPYGWYSNLGGFNISRQQSSDNVNLTEDATVDSIRWFGFFEGPEPNVRNFSIRLFTRVTDGAMGRLIYTDNVRDDGVDTGLNNGAGRDIFAYSADINPVSLTAGVTYQLQILSLEPDFWAWSQSFSEGDAQYQRFNSSDRFVDINDPNGSHAFSLFGTVAAPDPDPDPQPDPVPLPAGLSMLVAALLVFGAFARRSR